MSRRLVLVSHRFLHHSDHSGYDRLAEFLKPDEVRASRLNHWLSLGGRIGPVYSRANALTDVELLPRAWRGSDALFHVLYPENTMRLLPWFRGSRHRVVATVHQPASFFERLFSGASGGYWRGVYGRLDGVVTLCRAQRPPFEALLGPERVWTILYGVDAAYFRPGSVAPDLPAAAGGDTLLCVSVGNWMRNYDWLADVARAAAAGRWPVRFEVIALPESCRSLRGIPGVRCRSGLSEAELLETYRRAGVLLLPLRDACANTALVEGMACGLPIMVTDVGGVRDYVDAASAVIVPPNRDAMSGALRALLEDAPRRAALSAAARARAETIAWPRIAEALRTCYAALA